MTKTDLSDKGLEKLAFKEKYCTWKPMQLADRLKLICDE